MEKTSFFDGVWDGIMGKDYIDPEVRNADKSMNYVTGAMMTKIMHPNKAFARLMDKVDPKLPNECFVATAVYGDQDACEVTGLRDFRDNVLAQSAIGRGIIGFYYSGFGKKTAEFIEERIPQSIPLIKKGLDRIVETYHCG